MLVVASPLRSPLAVAALLGVLLLGVVPPVVSPAVAGGRDPDFARAARRVAASLVDLDIVGPDGRRRFASGFVVARDGTVVTAEHAVGGARRIVARRPDGRAVAATRIAADGLADVALLRLDDAAGLSPVTFATAPPRRGQAVAAFGNPLGFGGTLTVGVVSTATRGGAPDSPYDLVQHDAAINPGSSGGPLVDGDGAVVGMNVAIADGGRRDVGIGLAVPAAVVARIAERLRRDGALPRPGLGLRLRDASSLREAIPGLAGDGVVVEAVHPGSAAAAAGLAPGRLVVGAEGRAVRTTRDIARALEPKAPGDRFHLVVADGARRETIAFVLDERPRVVDAATSAVAPPPRFGLAFPPGSARVDLVAVGSPAEAGGLRAGDRLIAVGLERVDLRHPAEALLDAAIAAGGEGGVALLVERDGATRWLVLDGGGRLDTVAPFGSNSEAASSVLL